MAQISRSSNRTPASNSVRGEGLGDGFQKRVRFIVDGPSDGHVVNWRLARWIVDAI